MSTRSRARPWFAQSDRLERYSVAVDQLEARGGLWPAGPLLCAQDFDVERPKPCPHSFWKSKTYFAGRDIQFRTTCLKCRVPIDTNTGRPIEPLCRHEFFRYVARRRPLPAITWRNFNDPVTPTKEPFADRVRQCTTCGVTATDEEAMNAASHMHYDGYGRRAAAAARR